MKPMDSGSLLSSGSLALRSGRRVTLKKKEVSKHLIKKRSTYFAGCDRPGCVAGLEGGIVETMTQKDLDNFFQSSCPYVWRPGKKEMNRSQTIAYLLKYARKEIKKWEKLINYWGEES